MWRVKQRADMMRKLLDAMPRVEFSEEHCAQMCAKLKEIMPRMRVSV
jgi:hypothetical protein